MGYSGYERAILQYFRENPSSEASTSDIVASFQDFAEIRAILGNSFASNEQIRWGKRQKSKLHRIALYHLSRLVEDKVLRVSRTGKNSEKFFVLNLKEGQELILGGRRRFVITKPLTPAGLEGWERRGVVEKFESRNWVDRLNSVLVDCKKLRSLDQLYKVVMDCFAAVNDVVGVYQLENLCFDGRGLLEFLRKLEGGCRDFGKRVSVIIDVGNLVKESEGVLLQVLEDYIPKGIDFIFELNSKELYDHSEFFEGIIRLFAEKSVKLYIKNKTLSSGPYMLGKVGPYTFDEMEWKNYLKTRGQLLACGQCTLVIDVGKFFEEAGKFKIEEFLEFVVDGAKTLLSGNALQRKNQFKVSAEFSRNYIRLWNYGFNREDVDQEFVIDLLKRIRKKLDSFCFNEETIYKSCGMPIRFKVALSFGEKSYCEKIFTKPAFEQIEIKEVNDLLRGDIKGILRAKEKLFELFDSDRIEFHKRNNWKETVGEINLILNTYRIPFFSYDFVKSKLVNLEKYMR